MSPLISSQSGLLSARPSTTVLPHLDSKDIDQDPRTLVYGYDLDRTTVHIYMLSGQFWVYRYRPSGLDTDTREGRAFRTERVRAEHLPTKRIYPERSDAEFCKLALEAGWSLLFTTFDTSRVARDLQGYPLRFQGKLAPEAQSDLECGC